jgi:type I restriction-modification system DNA methylase subunit
MSVGADRNWRKAFGLEHAGTKGFFASKSELTASGTHASQAYILRRAFDQLNLDGILCTDSTPLIYFKRVKRIDPAEVVRLQHDFWNHGGAPILVLVAPEGVHVYSGCSEPVPQADSNGRIPSLVTVLDWVSPKLREFLGAVESGEFFRLHAESFNPEHRVDRRLLDNLEAMRKKLLVEAAVMSDPEIIDRLLCRIVFTCYLFDRGIIGNKYMKAIGLPDAAHLRDVLSLQPNTAKACLYKLFRKLGKDFNGNLFSDNLDAEEALMPASCISPLEEFFHATDIRTGQISFPFWIYDFGFVPIETISAIYERFLKQSEVKESQSGSLMEATDKGSGAFYTPRALAEFVLDVALDGVPSLLGRRFLDPACGSGIFLVGLFNRIGEEWRRVNPEASNDSRARALRKILCGDLIGVDINATACRITAFSLYLAYLDQLSPRDIQDLQQKGHKLPRLVHYPGGSADEKVEGSIWRGDFFAEGGEHLGDADLVIGNPPWGSTAAEDTPAAKWCANPDHRCSVPDKQIAAAFIWKATHHVADGGRICLLLPHGILFNHSATALEFQRTLFKTHAVDRVFNLADYRFFLFAEARHPAIVMVYRKEAPDNRQHAIEYCAPKADWLAMQAAIITIPPEDRCTLNVGEVLHDLEGRDAPQIWKQRYWATARDRRLIDRLSLYPRLRDHIRQLTEKGSNKRWLMAGGIQPVRDGDDPTEAATIQLPSTAFIEAKSSSRIDLFLIPSDCTQLSVPEFTVRSGSNKDTTVFNSPHVLVSKGFTSVAFADFHVSFQDFLRGIHGPEEDRDLLIFLSAYLRSRLAKFFAFHTSSHWGITRQQVHVDELLRLPFPLPESLPDPVRGWEIVREIGKIVSLATARCSDFFADRKELVREASESIDPLLDEYFDILPTEKILLNDTVLVTIPSIFPTLARSSVPTIEPSTERQREGYKDRLCDTLNEWAKTRPFIVRGWSTASLELGVGLALLQKIPTTGTASSPPRNCGDLLAALDRLRKASSRKLNTFELVHGVKVFDRDCLYVVKPIGHRFWTETAALNDADEIAGTILMHAPRGAA